MSNVAGFRLDSLLGRPLGIGSFLDLAPGLAKALDELHGSGFVHHCLHPAHVLVAADGSIQLLGCPAAGLPAAPTADGTPASIEPFAYMAPEQTGRMGGGPDARTDLYALGVIFYQLLTGSLPFTATDPMAWVHCHIARRPVPPMERDGTVPLLLSDLVMKLLAKGAADRYQTAAGLLADLQRCQAQWRAQERIDPFPLGEDDAPGRLCIPDRLYGRDQAFSALVSAYRRVAAAGQPELVLVAGPSGIGKSSLVRQLRQAMGESASLFATGKCDQYRRNVPYDALAQAFRQLMRQLLGRSQAEIDAWRQALLAALGPHAQLLRQLVPELGMVVGPQPVLPELPAPERERRFQAACRQFLSVFARPGQPLVLFLDDLQWLDASSLALLESLLPHREAGCLLLVGAYRDSELAAGHPLSAVLTRLGEAGVTVEEVTLVPLSQDAVDHLLADALDAPASQVAPLAQLVYQKTAGNPFFVIQYLAALAEEGLLAYNREKGAWQWDGAQIAARGFADNVAELLAAKLQQLPAPIRESLRLLACFGQGTEAATLALVRGDSAADIHAELALAVRAGLVLHQGDSYRFAHDRILEAAYALVPMEERPAMHLHIARRLANGWPSETRAERAFDLADHFNRGSTGLVSREERIQVAALNLLAGQRAGAASAGSAAATYFAAGRTLLPPDAWETAYDLAFGLALGLSGCHWLLGDFEAATALLDEVAGQARSLADQAQAYRLRISLQVTRGEYAAAVETALNAYTRWFGIEVPRHPEPVAVSAALEDILEALAGRAIADLQHLPAMADPGRRAAAAMISAALPAMYFIDPCLHDLMCCQVARWSLAYGNTEASAHAYAVVGAGLGQLFENWPAAYAFGRLARDLAESYGPGPWLSAAGFVAAFLIDGWVRPPHEVVDTFRATLQAARDCGELNHACYAASALVVSRLRAGDALEAVRAEAEAQMDALVGVRYEAFTLLVAAFHGLACRLAGRTGMNTLAPDGEGSLPYPVRLPILTCRIMADVLAGSGAEAAAAVLAARDCLVFDQGNLYQADFVFYAALALAAHLDRALPEGQAECLEILAGLADRLLVWEIRCPDNFRARARLVAAEIARLENRPLEAMELFEAAIHAAREEGILPYEALGWERASRFYRRRGFQVSADAYLREARRCYAAWGAAAKVAAIDSAYPAVRQPAPAPAAGHLGSMEQLDALAMVQASQAISGEILIDRLVEALLTTAVEHAGADRGVLVLLQEQEFLIEAEVAVYSYRLEVRLQRQPVTAQVLPESVLRYVARSRESLILDDSLAAAGYDSDPYVQSCRPRSLLCLPLLRQGELVGLLYLENRLAPQTFGRERLAVLELLASQAAISLENARLYAELREENAERQRAEVALQGNRALLQSIIDNSVAVIFVKDLEGRYLLVNRRYEELFHVKNEEMLGLTDYDLFPHDLADALRMADRQALIADATLECEESVPQDDGPHTYLALKFPLRDGEGQPYAVCGIATDITERKQAEADREARLAAEAANRAKGAFLATMSHELRTPLNAILGYAQLLGREPGLTERQAQGLETIRQSGHHLLILINDLLDFAKIEAGKFELQPTPVKLAQCLAMVAGIIRLKAEEKGLRFACLASAELPSLVLADEKRLRQVLLNLLANGVNFTDRGEVELKVERLDGEIGFARLHFQVTDTGIGIPAGQLETIFQPFEQAGEVGRRAGGTGLGLPISRQLVRLMGGSLTVESRVGRGSRFSFELELPVLTGLADDLVSGAVAGEEEAEAVPHSFLAPPPEELKALHDLALAGSMRDIRERASHLATLDPAYAPLADHLQTLARGYQSKAILALIERLLPGSQA